MLFLQQATGKHQVELRCSELDKAPRKRRRKGTTACILNITHRSYAYKRFVAKGMEQKPEGRSPRFDSGTGTRDERKKRGTIDKKEQCLKQRKYVANHRPQITTRKSKT
jgi:hypothetical protein